MFVLKKTYDKLRIDHLALQVVFKGLLARWNETVRRINAQGGEDFLSGKLTPKGLTEGDVDRLLMLCHPDKHDGKPMAVDMTARLLDLRKQLRSAKT